MSPAMPRLPQRKGSPRPPHPEAFHATPPEAIDRLVMKEDFAGPVGEFACGEGHISRQLEWWGFDVISTDLVDRGYGQGGVDFLADPSPHAGLPFRSLLTNPPFPLFIPWIERSLALMDEKDWPSAVNSQAGVALLAPVTYLAAQDRGELFSRRPPAAIWVFSKRILCVQGGSKGKVTGSGAVDYMWLVWRAPWRTTSFRPPLGWL
jgi:hypothetical protein